MSTSTVVICAYTLQRWEALCRAIESVRAQATPPERVLVVIDGNTELSTRMRAEYRTDRLVDVIDNNRTKGLSGARNTGILATTTPIVAFLDDDAVADVGWLTALEAELALPGVMIAGGWASPLHPDVIPAWWPREYDWVVGCSHEGLPAEGGAVRNVIGCAMAFRRDAFEIAGLFHESIGRVGDSGLGCEETELCIRLTSLIGGEPIRLVPSARVGHDVAAQRFTMSYLVKRCFAEGRSKARVRKMVGASALSAESAHVRSVLPKALVRSGRESWRREHGAPQRSVAIVVGVVTAGAGLVFETLRARPL